MNANNIVEKSTVVFDKLGNPNHEEGILTSTVENQTSKLPSITWLGLAVGSMVASAIILTTARKKEFANFVGLWAPCFMLVGVYNKLVKLEAQGTNPMLH